MDAESPEVLIEQPSDIRMDDKYTPTNEQFNSLLNKTSTEAINTTARKTCLG